MIYIIEGSNKVGKTTGLKKIKETNSNVIVLNNRYVNEYMHDRKHDSFISAISMLEMLIQFSDEYDIFIDRFHFSELVYGALNRGYFNDNMIDLDLMLKEKFKHNIKIILVKSNYNYIYNEKEKEHLFNIQKMFESLVKLSCNDIIVVNSDDFVNGKFN